MRTITPGDAFCRDGMGPVYFVLGNFPGKRCVILYVSRSGSLQVFMYALPVEEVLRDNRWTSLAGDP